MILKPKRFLVTLFLLVFCITPSSRTFADTRYTNMGAYKVQSTDGGKTYKTESGQDVTGLYNNYQKALEAFPDFGARGTNTHTRSNGDTLEVKQQGDGSLTIEIAHPKYPSLGTTVISAGPNGSTNTKFNAIGTGKEFVLNTTAEGKTTIVGANPTYINDGTSICTSTGCEYTLMAPIGSLLGDSNGKYKIAKDDKSGLCQLLNGWWRIGIALAGMLAVVMIVLGGFQYATTDSLFDKSEGKGKIQNALWGLLLALTTWLVVNTINPALTNCDINAKSVTLSALSTSVYNSGALGSDLMSLGMLGANNALVAAGSASTKSDSEIAAEYNKIYDQWTTADDEKLKYGDKDATDKWNKIQSEIDGLNTQYSSTQTKSGDVTVGSVSGVSDNGWRIYQETARSVGSTQCSISDISNGCANTVGNILKHAGYNIGAGDNTQGIQSVLSKSSNWQVVPGGLADSLPGDVVVSPSTQTKHGHTGIVTGVGGSSIAANSSSDGIVKEKFNTQKWTSDLEGSRGLKTYVYRIK